MCWVGVTVRWSLVLAALVAVGSGCKSSGSTGSSAKTAGAHNPKSPEDPVLTSDGGLIIDQAKWPDKKTNTGLEVSYAWRGQGEQKARVEDGGSFWRIVFPDRPKPDEVAKLTLRFISKTTEEQKVKIKNDITNVMQVVKVAIKKSIKKDQDQLDKEAFETESENILKAAEPLKAFRMKDGKPGDVAVLDAFGVQVENGKATLKSVRKTATIMKTFNAYDEETVKDRISKLEIIWKTIPAAEGCVNRINATKTAPDSKPWLDALKACSKELNKYVGDAAVCSDIHKSVKPLDDKIQDGKTTEEDIVGKLSEQSQKTIKAEIENLEGSGGLNCFPKPEANHKTSIALLGSNIATSYIHLNQIAKQFQNDPVLPVASIEVFVDELQQQRIGSDLLKGSGERRWYDVSTGVVYTRSVDDVVMPLLVSFCPFMGCLRSGETILDNVGHTFSVDLGFRSAIIGNPDPRHETKTGIFTGISWNPFFMLRASAGLYSFQNARTDNWNTALYYGATINVLHTAELLGVFGFGTPQPPKIETKKDPELQCPPCHSGWVGCD